MCRVHVRMCRKEELYYYSDHKMAQNTHRHATIYTGYKYLQETLLAVVTAASPVRALNWNLPLPPHHLKAAIPTEPLRHGGGQGTN